MNKKRSHKGSVKTTLANVTKEMAKPRFAEPARGAAKKGTLRDRENACYEHTRISTHDEWR